MQAPRLPDRVLGILRTPPESRAESEDGASEYGANHWGSPYPPHLRDQSSSSHSLSSEESEESPIHRLDLQTPFLRPAPPVQESQPEVRLPDISAAATVLANRARRIAHGITEGWIRQHTARGSDQEKRHWFSDGTGDSENSSLSGSFSGEEAAWLGSDEARTPKASRKKNSSRRRQSPRGDLAKQSSSETLRNTGAGTVRMAPPGEWGAPDGPSEYVSTTGPARALWGSRPAIERPRTPTIDRDLRPRSNGRVGGPNDQPNIPTTPTPSRSVAKRATNATTPRLKKRVPWKTKSVMVLLPRDDERGLPGKAQIPLKEAAVNGMLRSWQQLGYDTEGFDLYPQTENLSPRGQSQSRGAWPDFGDLARERKQGGWKVLLPDLNGRSSALERLSFGF